MLSLPTRARGGLVAALAVTLVAVPGLTVTGLTVDGLTASAQAAAAEPVVNPVIVLHGITGSSLRNPGGEVWPQEGATSRSLSDDHFDVLRLQADGLTPWRAADPAYQVSVDRGQGIGGLIDRVELCVLSACVGLSDVYDPTFAYLRSRGYVVGVDAVPFAFDWRRDIDANAALLLDEIDRVRAATGAAEVDLVAHSQGGLVARAALGSSRSVGRVDRVAVLGTPVLGATQFLGVLDYREPCQSAELFGGCILNRAKAQTLATNWPGALALLPSPAYFTAYGSPINRLVDDDGDGRVQGFLSESEVRARLADRNLRLIDQATALHRRIDPWTPADPSVQLTRFVGTGLGTIERVEEYRTERCSGALWWRSCSLVEAFRMQLGDGDGTVARHSADVHDPDTGLDLRGSGTTTYVGAVEHGDLVTDTEVLRAVVDFLQRPDAAVDSTQASDLRSQSQTDSRRTTSSDPARTDPVAVEPGGLTGVEVTALGPLQAQVVDSTGARTGSLDPQQEVAPTEVPGATAAVGEFAATVFLAGQDRYRVDYKATDNGDVVLQVRTVDADEVATVRSVGPLRVAAGARLSLAVRGRQGAGALRLAVDDDGNGRVDRRERLRPVQGARAARDHLAPEVGVSLRSVAAQGGRAMVEVTVNATDSGSGVAQVDYGLDPSGTAGVYTGPFVVPADGTVNVRAVDRAGNVTAPYVRVPLS